VVKGEIFSVYLNKNLFKSLKEYVKDSEVNRSKVVNTAIYNFLSKRGYIRE